MFQEMRWYGFSVWNLRRRVEKEARNHLILFGVYVEMIWYGNMVSFWNLRKCAEEALNHFKFPSSASTLINPSIFFPLCSQHIHLLLLLLIEKMCNSYLSY